MQTRFGQIPIVQAIPQAPYTWESKAVLPGNRQETGRIRMAFNRPIIIVGCHVSLTQLAAAAPGQVPDTIEDVEILLEMDRGDRFTSSNSDTGNASGEFVTLASLDQVKGGRYLNLVLDIAAPVLQITYRHQRDVNVFSIPDALVKCAFFAQYLEG